MTIFETEPVAINRPQGAKSLRPTCLEHLLDRMSDITDCEAMASSLPHTLQTALWKILLSDRKEKEGLQSDLSQVNGNMFLADIENILGIDPNLAFIEEHAQEFRDHGWWTDNMTEDDLHELWNSMVDVLKALEIPEYSSVDPGFWTSHQYISLVENSKDSCIRFSICTSGAGQCHHCRSRSGPGPRHYKLGELISGELLLRRAQVLTWVVPVEAETDGQWTNGLAERGHELGHGLSTGGDSGLYRSWACEVRRAVHQHAPQPNRMARRQYASK